MTASRTWDEMTPPERQKLLAQAKVGMRALVDEATGHQSVRPADDLARTYADLGGEQSDYRAPGAPEDR